MDKFQTLHELNHPEVNVYPNIQEPNIPSNAITTAKIVDNAITTAKVADGAITTAKIADASITHDKLASSSVDTSNIVSSAVTSGKIASSAVTTAKIANFAVTNDKLAPSCVTEGKVSRTIVSLTDYLDNVTFAQMCTALIKLVTDGINFGFWWSDDGLVAVAHAVEISVDTGAIEIYQLKSGGWSNMASLASDADVTTFLAGLGKEIYLKVMN